MFCCRSHGDIGLLLEYSRGCQGICNHPPLLWIVNNIVTFKLCSQKFKPNQKILLKIRTADFLMILAKNFSSSSFFLSFFLFSPFFLFFLLIAWSKFALIFHIARFQFQEYKNFSFWEGTSPSDTPCVCKYAIGADAPPNHPPMSKTDVQPSVVLVY